MEVENTHHFFFFGARLLRASITQSMCVHRNAHKIAPDMEIVSSDLIVIEQKK